MSELTIIVCIKPVPDPECPSSSLEINAETRQVIPVGIPPVLNPFDENALEAALRIKDTTGAKVIAVTMVNKSPGGVLHKARTGADEMFLLQDEGFENLDSYSTAYILAAAIRKMGNFSLVLTGRQSADWSYGATGHFIAGILNIPAIALVKKISVDDNGVIMERLRKGGSHVIWAPMPSLATISSEIGGLRLFPLKAINDARKKPMTTWNMQDLEIDTKHISGRKIVSLSPPPSRKRDCVFIDGKSPEEIGEGLALRLRQDGVL